MLLQRPCLPLHSASQHGRGPSVVIGGLRFLGIESSCWRRPVGNRKARPDAAHSSPSPAAVLVLVRHRALGAVINDAGRDAEVAPRFASKDRAP